MDSDILSRLGTIMADKNMTDRIRAVISGSAPAPPCSSESPACNSEPSVCSPEPPACKPEYKQKPPPCDPEPPCKPVPPCPGPCPSDGQSAIKHAKTLLNAVKPYLDAERCEKIDRILNAMKLAEYAGLFRMFTGNI